MNNKKTLSRQFHIFLLIFVLILAFFPISQSEGASKDVILLWDGASIPDGWTCVSCESGDAFYQRFPRAAPTYGGTFDAPGAGHTHTYTLGTVTMPSNFNVGSTGTLSNVSSVGHTHTAFVPTIGSSTDIEPPYKNLKFIKATNPTTLPSGIIGMFDVAEVSLPTNWTAYSDLNSGNYLRGEGDTLTGGSASHNHSRDGGTLGGSSGQLATLTGLSSLAHVNHSHSIASGNTPTETNDPLFATLVFAKLTVDGDAPPDGLIAMFDDSSLPLGWSIISGSGSTYENRLIKGDTTAGTQGGDTSHAHGGSDSITTGGSSPAQSATSAIGSGAADNGHTHVLPYTISSAANNSMPSYRDVILAKLKAITISGTVYSGEGTGPLTSRAVKGAVSGIAIRNDTTDGSGNYSLVVPDPGVGSNITIWLDGETEKGVVITSSGGGDTSGIDIYQNHLIVRHEDSGPITNSNLGICDKTTGSACGTTDLFFDESSGVLTVDSGVKIFVWSGKTYTPGGDISTPEIKIVGTLSAGSNTITLSGSGTPLVISGTFTSSTSTVDYTGTSATNITLTTYYNLESSPAGTATHTLGTGASQTITVNNNLTIGNGTNLVTVTANTNNPILDISGNTTINANATFIAPPSSSFTVGGSWSNSGTFTHNSGTVTFDATTTGKTITSGGSSFNDLVFNGSGGEWTLQDTTTLASDLSMRAGTLIGTANLTVEGGDIVCSVTCGTITFTGGTTTLEGTGNLGTTSLNPTWAFNNLTLGDGTTDTTTAQGGGTISANTLTIASNQTLNAGSKTYQLTANNTPFVVSGTFTPSTSTVTYAPSGTSGVNVTSTTYNNVIFNKASNTFSLQSGGITTQNGGDLTITAGTLDTVSGQNYPISVGGSWSNSDIFTANSGTVTFTATSTETITPAGNDDFYNIAFNGSGGAWSFSGITDLTINSVDIIDGTFTGVTGTTTVTGDWGNTGTYTAGASGTRTVQFTTASTHDITGSTTFHNLTFTEEDKTLRFEPTPKRTKITGTITIGGSSPTYVCAFPVNLFSTSAGNKWELELDGGSASIEYAHIKDSEVIGTAINADNTFKENTTNWTGTGCLPKMTINSPSPDLEGNVDTLVNLEGYDLEEDATAVVQWDGTDTSQTISTDSRGKFEADVAGYDTFNFVVPEDEAGVHTIAISSNPARSLNNVSATANFTIEPWFWMSAFSAHTNTAVTFIGNGYGCGKIAQVVWGGVDTGDTTNISGPSSGDCDGGGGDGVTVNEWEEVGDF